MAFTIQPFKPGQEADISVLIRNVHDEFVAPDYTEEGNAFFYDWIASEKIAERQKAHISLFVAVIDSILVVMIEIRENNIISLLFVDRKYQRQGIAKSLVATALPTMKTSTHSMFTRLHSLSLFTEDLVSKNPVYCRKKMELHIYP